MGVPSTPETTTPGFGLILVIVGIGVLLLIAVIITLAVRSALRNKTVAALRVSAHVGAEGRPVPQTFEQRLIANDRLYEEGSITAKEHSHARRRLLDGR